MVPTARPALRLLVVRSGGFAGTPREWRVETDDVAPWDRLLEACPWGSAATDHGSRDRFVWRIEATRGRRRRSASVPEAGLTGPWQTLVAGVRSWAEASRG